MAAATQVGIGAAGAGVAGTIAAILIYIYIK
jgi:hypothetical protein